MTQENICVTFTGPNKTDVLGYFNAKDNGENGVALGPGTKVRVNLSVTVNGHSFRLQAETDIPFQLFQQLKSGKHAATAELVPFPENVSQPTRKRKRTEELACEPKRKSSLKSALGTSGKKKYFNGGEVAWVDIVELALNNCGSTANLSALYKWARENIYTIIGGRKCSISELNNWQASIRQNRRRARNYESLAEAPVKTMTILKPQIAKQFEEKPKPNLMDANELNAEIDNYYAESQSSESQFCDSPVFNENGQTDISAEFMISQMIDELRNTAANFEQTKVPMQAEDADKRPCLIPNPFEQTILFDFI